MYAVCGHESNILLTWFPQSPPTHRQPGGDSEGEEATGNYIRPKILSEVGQDVTDDFIGDKSFGHNTIDFIKVEEEISPSQWQDFVDSSRIVELQGISSKEFDLARLLKLIEELNGNYRNRNYLSVGMLGRTIMNHVPPIFGHKTFDQVAANQSISKKKSFLHLQDSLRNIADDYLHQPIRNKESLPNATQVDFRQSMDVLLEEIVRLLK